VTGRWSRTTTVHPSLVKYRRRPRDRSLHRNWRAWTAAGSQCRRHLRQGRRLKPECRRHLTPVISASVFASSSRARTHKIRPTPSRRLGVRGRSKRSRYFVRSKRLSPEGRQRPSGSKLGGKTLRKRGRDSQIFGRQSTSFANKSRGKSLHSSKHTCKSLHSSKHTGNPQPQPQMPIPPIHEIYQKPPPVRDTIDTKSPLADNLQLEPWPSSRAQHRGRFLVMYSIRERNITQFLPNVFTAQSTSSGSI
jgi:hypothetical protein